MIPRLALITVTAFSVAACSPLVIRESDGLLILNEEFPETFNASEDMGILYAKGFCIIFAVEGFGEFQPVFRKGTTRARLERQLGDLSKPRAVTTGGFEGRDAKSTQLAKSEAVKDCPGQPFLSIGFELTANIKEPPTPYPAQP